MRRGITTAARAGLIGLALLMAGCGWFSGGDAADGPAAAGLPFGGPLDALARGVAIYAVYDIYNVIPNQGPLAGGQPVLLEGFFPAVTNAAAIYTVYFGANAATYDISFTPFFTTNDIYVVTPPGDAPGLVDVILRDTLAALDTAAEYDGYEYIDPFALLAVDPDQGPLRGGTPVEIIGRFPIIANISTIAAAYSAYSVYFGANRADFDPLFDPVITAERMYVITPRGDLPGFVDVSVEIIGTDPLDFRSITDGFEYIDDFALLDVIPDAGPLAGGQQVELIGRFPIIANISTIAAAYSAYTVYFGANLAVFDASFDPVITSERMYVITPPGDMPGLVDVTVVDAINEIAFLEAIDLIAGTYDFRRLQDGYEYLAEIELTNVDPDLGFILGDFVSPVFNFVDKPVTLTGTFPVTDAFSIIASAADAYAAYGVYFGNRRAFFDSSVMPVITAENLYVLAPAGEDVGPVDVRVEINLSPSVFATLERAYSYYSMYIGAIIPNSGPLSGGNPVEIHGLFLAEPNFSDAIDAGVDSLIAAEQIYSVFFDANQAIFDSSVIPPITFASIDTINKVYVANRLYVAAPPGDMLGFVDVIVFSDLDREAPAISDPLKYEYVGGLGIGLWLDATVQPNPVGKLPQGHLLVTIQITGTMTDTQVFIVPQGGDPLIEADWIHIDQVPNAIITGQGITAWTGTNREFIDTVSGTGKLTDGHAQLFILEPGSSDPVAGGTIHDNAEDGRHFIIDTIPPRVRVSGFNTGLNFLNILPAPFGVNSDTLSTADIPFSPFHPYPVLPGGIVATDPIPGDQSTILNNNRAQIFYNAGSISNAFDLLQFEPLRFDLVVEFEDVSVYTALGLFDPGDRQVAGFDTTPLGPLLQIPPGRDLDTALVNGDNVLVQWDIQSMAAGIPDITGINTLYTTSSPDFVDGSVISSNLAPANTVLRAEWEADIGIEWTGQNILMPIVFRAVDRAGNYFPRGDTSLKKRKLWTLPEATVGPLNLWWLITTGTEFIDGNFPASENTRNPNFKWRNPSRPDPDTIPGPDRLFSYRLWNTDGTAPREEARNGLYRPLMAWSEWLAKDFLTANDMRFAIDLSEGAWMLLVVVAADEAGNVEQWPLNDLGDITIDPMETIIIAPNAASNGNWRRWYVAPAEQVVETEVSPTFWHDRVPLLTIEANERVLGNIEIVPLPARNSNEVVSVEFRVDVVPDPSTVPQSVDVSYVLLEEGQVFDSGTVSALPGQTNVFIPFGDLGNRVTRQPVHYVFQATGIVSDGASIIVDSTPANFKFVVVDNVAKFIEGREDNQPIKVQDQP